MAIQVGKPLGRKEMEDAILRMAAHDSSILSEIQSEMITSRRRRNQNLGVSEEIPQASPGGAPGGAAQAAGSGAGVPTDFQTQTPESTGGGIVCERA